LANQPQPWVPWVVAIVASLAAAATDLRSRRIYNWLTGPVFIGGLVWSTAVCGLSGAAESMMASLLLAMPFVLLFLFAGGGAADAKLMGALGAWLGLGNGTPVLLAVVCCGALLGIAHALLRRQASGVVTNLILIVAGAAFVVVGQRDWRSMRRAMPQPTAMMTIPYGLAIFAGVCAAAAVLSLWHGRGMAGT
jgi:prepilin peptidase CpaA